MFYSTDPQLRQASRDRQHFPANRLRSSDGVHSLLPGVYSSEGQGAAHRNSFLSGNRLRIDSEDNKLHQDAHALDSAFIITFSVDLCQFARRQQRLPYDGGVFGP